MSHPDDQEPAGIVSGERSAASEISRRMVALLRGFTGRGPTAIHTIAQGEAITVVFRGVLTKGELDLVAHGDGDAVEHIRKAYHERLCAEGTAAVEGLADREVISCLADIDVEADVAVLVFVLASDRGA